MVKSEGRTDTNKANGNAVLATMMRDAGLSEETVSAVVGVTLETPRGLITLREATSLFSIPSTRLYEWIRRGHLRVRGRERFHARGGGTILVARNDVAKVLGNPPRPGRPKTGRPRKLEKVETPRGLITLREAAKLFSIPSTRLYEWIQRGHLRVRGRERFHAPGGGKILVARNDVADVIHNLPRIGRPKSPKTQERNLISLRDAAEKYGLVLGTLQTWVKRGHLLIKGRERFHAPGGGKILVDEQNVAQLSEKPPKTWRPRKLEKVETPRGLITLREAAKLFSIPSTRLHEWIRRGHLRVRGRERFHAPGGGKILVDRSDVADVIHNPPRIGRPKSPKT